jgi:hypothetical protein
MAALMGACWRSKVPSFYCPSKRMLRICNRSFLRNGPNCQ